MTENNLKQGFIFDLPKKEDNRGNLSFLERGNHVPFPIVRTYWVYDVPGGQERGSHAFRNQQEIIIALSGSFDVILNTGSEEKTYTLNRAYKALYVPSMTWRTLSNFSTNSVCLVLNSGTFCETEYIRNYDEFKNLKTSEFTTINLNTVQDQKNSNSLNYNVFNCSLLELPTIYDRAGNITPVESNKNIPFAIERVFYIYDIPNRAERGMHAHKYCHELLIATTGSFTVELDDGANRRTVHLNSPKVALHIPPGIWAKQVEYSSGATCLVITSEKYDSSGYINSYEEFKKYKNENCPLY